MSYETTIFWDHEDPDAIIDVDIISVVFHKPCCVFL